MSFTLATTDARILIVDDDAQSVGLLTHILKSKGYTAIQSTTDPRNAVSFYQQFAPDLILLDLNMPHLNGFQVMEALQKVMDDTYLPVIVLSGQGDQEKRRQALELGAKDFIMKPFDLIELRTRIQNMLEVRLLHNQIREHRNQLEHYVSPSTRRVIREGKDEGASLARRTIIFSDLRGFTSFSERYSPVLVFEILEGVLEVQTDVIEKHSGEVDKFIGDCVMGVFIDASNAARAAREMIEESKRFLTRSGSPELIPGIGINTGEVMEGVIGQKHRRSYTLIGDTVNVAARLCSSAPSGHIAVSASTYQELDPSLQQMFALDNDVTMRGRSQAVSVRMQRVSNE
ncbi:MAG: response regulator [Planctomycetaceae bacterium]|nr:response regulator [Planctomycetaceae bacterium]